VAAPPEPPEPLVPPLAAPAAPPVPLVESSEVQAAIVARPAMNAKVNKFFIVFFASQEPRAPDPGHTRVRPRLVGG
jgi:hypothetical protein